MGFRINGVLKRAKKSYRPSRREYRKRKNWKLKIEPITVVAIFMFQCDFSF